MRRYDPRWLIVFAANLLLWWLVGLANNYLAASAVHLYVGGLFVVYSALRLDPRHGRIAVLLTERGLKFSHLPLDPDSPDTWTLATFNRYRPVLEAITTPTIVHCASGYRSSAFVLTFQAFQRGLCRDWVIAEAERVGFNLHSAAPSSHDLEVLEFAYAVLGC